jgi:hypothetical protein
MCGHEKPMRELAMYRLLLVVFSRFAPGMVHQILSRPSCAFTLWSAMSRPHRIPAVRIRRKRKRKKKYSEHHLSIRKTATSQETTSTTEIRAK